MEDIINKLYFYNKSRQPTYHVYSTCNLHRELRYDHQKQAMNIRGLGSIHLVPHQAGAQPTLGFSHRGHGLIRSEAANAYLSK